jgi:hypothetical protein
MSQVLSQPQRLLPVTLLLFWYGCGSTMTEPPTTPQACDKVECQASCEAIVRNLNMSEDPTLVPPFTSTRCAPFSQQDAGTQASCLCERGIAVIPLHGLGGQPSNLDGCLYYGKDFQCLYHVKDFLGCDLNTPETSCQAACDDLLGRLRDDTAQTLDATAHGGVCTKDACFCTVALSGMCYVHPELTPYDCSLPAEDILRLRSENR